MHNYSDFYPCLIFMTRYQGTYEGGRWASIAFTKTIPELAVGSDSEASMWWGSYESRHVGRGETPEEAYEDMVTRHLSVPSEVKDEDGNTYTVCGSIDCEDGFHLNQYRICTGNCLKRPLNKTYYLRKSRNDYFF